MWWPTTQLAISHRTFIVDARGAGYLQMRWRILGSLQVSLAHVLSGIAVGILSVVLRTVISCGRDEYGAVEKTLKSILTICTLLVFPLVVALWWTIYIGVKRFRYGGSVVPAMPSASGIRVFTTKLRGLLHQSESTQYGLVPVVHFRKESCANVVLSSGTICSRRFLSA